jgi:nucleoid DNA-binding protein
MERNIIALLNSNLRVIIPDFGAFIIRQKQPRIIVFNEFLRYNDGLLIEYIAKTEGIDREVSEQRVMDFAEEGTKIINSGKVFTIEGLGSLHKDSSGKVHFIEVGEEVSPDMVTFQPVEPEIPMEIQAPDEPAPEAAVPKPKAKRKAKEEEKIPEPTQVLGEIEPVPEPEREMPEVASAAEPPPEIPGTPATDSVPESEEAPVRNRTNQVLIWIAIILFANAAILAWFVFRDNIREKSETPAEITDSLYQQLADSVKAAAMDSSLLYEQTPEPVEGDITTAQPATSRYYIVAGCFSDEANADELVASLKKLGYRAEKFGKIGNLYAVSFASFDDKEKAVNELKIIREKAPDAWMTHF